MTAKQANKYSLISFITALLMVLFLFIFANIFPQIELNALGRNIIVGALILPWISFLIFMFISIVKGSKD
ncbi:hypothetical protein [Francisella philomiragia]|uniref:hypothetical protein n=1 Tax=Francisella philomiragia TaxID=28110 RepID=UPI0035187687